MWLITMSVAHIYPVSTQILKERKHFVFSVFHSVHVYNEFPFLRLCFCLICLVHRFHTHRNTRKKNSVEVKYLFSIKPPSQPGTLSALLTARADPEVLLISPRLSARPSLQTGGDMSNFGRRKTPKPKRKTQYVFIWSVSRRKTNCLRLLHKRTNYLKIYIPLAQYTSGVIDLSFNAPSFPQKSLREVNKNKVAQHS